MESQLMFLDCPAYLNEEDPGHPSYYGIERTLRTMPGKAIRSAQSVRAAFAVAEMIMRPNRRQWADLTVRWKPAAPSALSRSPATRHR
jgi:hypothetical protein